MASKSSKANRPHVGTQTKADRRRSDERKRSTGGAVRSGDLLPRCVGPKMHPFKNRNLKIEYDALISSSGDETTSGGEGHVFKVRIESKYYALKLFKFFPLDQQRQGLPSIYMSRISDDELEGHLDPFYAECRAYGAIEEKLYGGHLPQNENDWVAVPCYGYVKVPVEDEKLIRRKFKVADWDREDEADTEPIRGLVKELIEQEAPVDAKRRSVRRMRKDLLALQSIGVFPRDVFARNYRAGLLVDFGHSYTEPHCMLRVLPWWRAEAEKTQDLSLFDNMIKNLHIKIPANSMPQRIVGTRLEMSRRKASDFWELDGSGRARRTIGLK